MSANLPAGHGTAGHDHGHDTAPGHATLRGYLTGFVLSVILTAIPFWLVMSGVLDSKQATAMAIMAFAVVQIVVHMIFFLHMDARSEGGWSLMALIFTLILVVIALTGSLWVMYHLNVNMMPGMHEMKQMP
ncbi:MAG: cytochrome o ubiquinol oxidase subunit IV [Proteobacteria bacterium]|nr:cytochrome o ubiquinol oxidase subunit IV [Pseudomonadota bacterium]